MEVQSDVSYNSSVLGGTLAVILTFILINKVRDRKYPPGPSSLPVFGSVGFFLQFKRKRHHLLSELEMQYGKIFSIRAGQQLVVFLNGYELINEAFVKQSDIFSDRPNWLTSLQLGLADGKGIVWQDKHCAAHMRKFTQRALRQFGVAKSTLEQKSFVEIEAISTVLGNNKGQRVLLKPLLKKAVTNIIHDIIFGSRFEFEDKKLQEVLRLIDDFFKGGLFIPRNFLPKMLCKLLPKDEKEYARKQAVVEKLKQYIYKHIQEHEQEFVETYIGDFIDLYIFASSSEKEEEENILSKGNIFRTILDLFLAGAETTASTLQWCFLYMVKYPDIQERCYQEIIQMTSSTTASVDISYRGKLPYTEATILEVQRLSTIVPLGVPHLTSCDTTLREYFIPARTIVFSNLYSCAMDPSVWANPGDFNPDRHINDNGKLQKNEKLIPFSIGPRMCLGKNMAQIELFLVFTNLLRQFKFEKSGNDSLSINSIKEDQPITSTENFSVIAAEREPF